MDFDHHSHSLVAIVGAGPAGLYAAHKLADNGVRVLLINRDVKPGGLAEYGIYPDKYKMKGGLRKQFRRILDSPLIDYYGNATVCAGGDLTIYDLMEAGFQAILVTTGAQGTKWLGLDGEYLRGVFHAKELVYHYNRLPPFSAQLYQAGARVALVGVGNVMIDVAHWLVREVKVREVIAVARRGPMEVKFTREDAKEVAAYFDIDRLDADLARLAPLLTSLGQDPAAARELFTGPMAKAVPRDSDSRLRFEFLASPRRILGDRGHVIGLEVEENTLLPSADGPRLKGLGKYRTLDVDTVIFCIGDTVDRNFCLPTRNNEYVTAQSPRFPVDGLSYEAYDPERNRTYENVFLAGWARKASTGLVGVARHDGENGADVVLSYLKTLSPMKNIEAALKDFEKQFERFNRQAVCKDQLPILETAEQAEAERRGLEEYKFPTNEEMLAIMGVRPILV